MKVEGSSATHNLEGLLVGKWIRTAYRFTHRACWTAPSLQYDRHLDVVFAYDFALKR
jgi:hypothetical protein